MARRKEKFPLAIISLYGCDPERLDNSSYVAAYIRDVCDEIGVIRVGQPLVAYRKNGELTGLSVGQIIKTSHIIFHGYPLYQFAIVDIFSCKNFDQRQAARFSKNYFQAQSYRLHASLI